MVGEHHVPVSTVAQRVACTSDGDQIPDQAGQLIRLWLVKAGAERLIVIRSLRALLAPLASVINTRNAWHAEEEAVSKGDMLFVCQYGCQSCHIVIIYKCHQMLATVNAPLLRSILTVQRVCDLEHVHAVEA